MPASETSSINSLTLSPRTFAQELLSTFSTSLGEVSLVPSTGGVFTIDLTHALTPVLNNQEGASNEGDEQWNTQTTRIWDRKAEGGFPETKALKKLVRDIIDPSRDLGHVDRHKAPPLPPPNLIVPAESSSSGVVSVQDQKSSLEMATAPAVTITQVARREGNSNDDTKSCGNGEGERGGSPPTEAKVENRLLLSFPEQPPPQQKQEPEKKKNDSNRVICEDCT